MVLEQELKMASRDWEMTFDELSEPIAIFDLEGKILRANAHWSEEFKDLIKDSTSTLRHSGRQFAVEKYPIRVSEQSETLSWVVYLRDETRSLKLKSQMVQIEKMSAIGQLAGHIAHELNNPLTGIRALTQVMLSEIPPTDQVHKDLLEVEGASARCQNIINNLLDFSKGGIQHKVERVDLNEIVERTLPFLKSAMARFRTNVDLYKQSLFVRAEPHLLQQVIFNLVNNACQAMREKGSIEVHTDLTSAHAILEIKDSGPGIDEKLMERIFEPFFTTKLEGEGTGLGLSLSRDFVRQFGGELECQSTHGEGTTFRVRLPLERE
jgi:signal transduction histidine kinase